MRSLIVSLFLLASSSSASAFDGKVSVGVENKPQDNQITQSIGLVMQQPLFLGLGWWSWTGFGQTLQKDVKTNHWLETRQGITWTSNKFGVSALATYGLDKNCAKYVSSYVVNFDVKAW